MSKKKPTATDDTSKTYGEEDAPPRSAYSSEEAKRRIVLTLRDGEIVYSEHVKRDILSGRHGATFQDILHVLQHGEIVREPEWDDTHRKWKYKVEGADLEDEELRVITIIIDEQFRLFIVTAY